MKYVGGIVNDILFMNCEDDKCYYMDVCLSIHLIYIFQMRWTLTLLVFVAAANFVNAGVLPTSKSKHHNFLHHLIYISLFSWIILRSFHKFFLSDSCMTTSNIVLENLLISKLIANLNKFIDKPRSFLCVKTAKYTEIKYIVYQQKYSC